MFARLAEAVRARGRPLVHRLRGETGSASLLAQGVRLGRNVYIGRSTTFDGGFPWLISVGADSTISAGVEVLAHDASTRRHLGYTIVATVDIGSRVYVGAGAIILPGVTIGDDAIIGAGSVVTGDIPAGALAVGAPAKVVGTTAGFVDRHRRLMEHRPVFRGAQWTRAGGITEPMKRRMLEDLQDGPGYVP